MHNNYYFLRQLSTSLQSAITNAVISECFSQSKEELIIRFETYSRPFYIKASLLPSFSCISFPENFQRARRNSVDLFPMLIGQRVSAIRQYDNERSFTIELSNDLIILFKMHGNRSNVVLFEKDRVITLFKKNIKGDQQINLHDLDRKINWSYENFVQHHNKPESIYFTFGKLLWYSLEKDGFQNLSVEQQWQRIQNLRQYLEHPVYYITYIEGSPALSLVNIGDIKREFTDPLQAVNEFYYQFTQVFTFHREKSATLSKLKARLHSGKNYYEKNFNKLSEIELDTSYRAWADLLMANLHDIRTGSEKVTLQNFYNENKPIEIKIKKDLTPQANAEVFYRKAKNQQIEINRLQQALEIKEKEMQETESFIHQIEEAKDLRSLRQLTASLNLDTDDKDDSITLPYHEFEMQGFKIWVGKNAEHNDTLTFKYGFKEDLWLHAKDVAGSHVLIKYQAGKKFPKPVIERAAELAAYNSKRKNDTLCPVIVTPRKFIRKRKGDPAGAVVVEREEVILVEPRL